MVPEGWKLKKLGSIIPRSYTNGIYKSSEFYGEGVEILRINDFDNHGNLSDSPRQRVRLTEKEAKGFYLSPGDIVFNRVNSITHLGKSVLWDEISRPTVYESNMMRIPPDRSRILPTFLIIILQSTPNRNYFRRTAKRAVAQSSINQQDVKSMQILLPPLPEQKKIAKILSARDEAIATTQQLLTGKRRVRVDKEATCG